MASATDNNNNFNNMTEEEKNSIANAKIVFIVAVNGCGKSFTGDYLQSMHGYSHVDGDGPLKKCHIPRNREMTVDFMTNFWNHINKKREDGPEELWQPYMGEIADHTIETAKKTDKVVLSHATYRQSHREFIVDRIVEGGARRENITVLQLIIDPDVKLKGLYYRTKEHMENGGMTVGDNLRTHGWEGEDEMTCAEYIYEYIQFMKKEYPEYTGNGAFVDIPIGYGKIVDVSVRDMTYLDGVDEALGLVGERKDKALTFEQIRDKVKLFDMKRDGEFASTGAQEIMNKIIKDTMGGDVDNEIEDDDDDTDTVIDNDVDEQEKIAKRRSSLISVEYLERLLMPELRHSSLDSSSDDNKNIIKARRRSSLIQIGRIDPEE